MGECLEMDMSKKRSGDMGKESKRVCGRSCKARASIRDVVSNEKMVKSKSDERFVGMTFLGRCNVQDFGRQDAEQITLEIAGSHSSYFKAGQEPA